MVTSHLDEMKTKLEQSEAQLQDYVRTSGLTVTSDKQNLAENGLKQLQDELSKAQADRIASQAKFEEAKNSQRTLYRKSPMTRPCVSTARG